MANQGKIQFGVGFNVDKSGLNQLKAELQSLQSLSEKDLIKIGSTDAINDLQKIKDTAHQVEQALEKSFNPKLNTTDLTKFRTELNNAGLNISSIKASFDKAGQSGQNAFRNLTTELLTTNKHLKESSQLVQKMADTLSNTVRWSIASSALNSMTGQIQKAWSFTKQLDSSLNNIRIVTGKSADEMDRFAVQATKAAQALGASTKSYSDAALIYYQQGLAEQDVQARAAVTTKVANVTGQSAATVSENLTAVWNGYKVSAAEAELYIDKLSAVAATTAADLEELSVGMSRVASAANIMGVDIDSLNAQLATIVSVTREAPESIGTALKTVYARMSDIESGLDAETTLGEYTQQMKAMGINVLDATGNLRDMDSVIEEIGNNWDKLSRNQQVSLAQTIAGTRQYSRMMALFDNWDMYQSSKRTSETSAGELQKQQDIYLDSMEAHLNKLQAETEELYQTLMDPKGLNPLIDALTGIVGLVENFTEALGGGAGALHTFGAIGLNVFNKQITQGITRTVSNISGAFENRQRDISQQALINEYGFLTDGGKVDERTEKLIDAARQRYKVLDAMSEEEQQQSKELIKQTNEYYKQQDALKAQKAVIDDIAQRYADMTDTSDAKEVTKAIGESVGEIKRQAIEASDLAGLKEVGTTQHAVATKKTRIATAHDAMQTAYDDGDEEHFDKYYDEWTTQIKELTCKQEEAASAAKKQKHAIENVVTVINESTVGTMANAEQQEKLEKITKAVNKAYDQNGNIIADTEQEIEEANKAVEEYNKLLEEMAKEGIEVGKSVKKVNADLVDNKKRIEEAEAALEKAKKNFDLTKNINQIVKLGGGLANIGSSIATIQNLGSIWNNDDLTTGEKVLQTIISMTTALSMMASGISTVKESFSFFKSIPKLFDELKKAREAAAAANVAANVAETGSEVGLEKKIEETNKDKAERITLNKAQSNSSGDVAKSNIVEGASENADDLSGKEGGKKLSKKGGKWLAKQAGKTGVRAAGGAIAGAVAAAAVSLAIFDYVANAEKRAMEGAQEASNAMQETLSAVTASYDKLNSSISNLENATETLEGLTEGTVEWKQALHDVNSQVLDLLREYPELNQYIARDSNGQLVVEKEGLELIQEKQLAAVQKTQAAAMIAQAKADRENVNYLEEEWADAANKSDVARGAVVGTAALSGAAAGAVGASKIGAAVGTAITPGVGTAIGVAAGAVIGSVVGAAVGGIGTAITEAAEMNNIAENEDFKAAFEAYKTSGAGIFDSNEALAKALGKDVSALSSVEKALVANKNATVDLCNALLNKEAQDLVRWEEIGAGILGDEASRGAKLLAGQQAAESDLKSYDEVKKEYGGFNDADERAIKKLLELSGMGTYVGVAGADKVQYRDKNTGEIVDKDIDWVYKQLQYYLSVEEARNRGAEYETEAAKLTNLFSGAEAKEAVSNLVVGAMPDLAKLTKSQYEKFIQESVSAMSALSEEEQNLLNQSITQYHNQWNDIITSLPEEIQNSFSAIIGNADLNIDQLQDAATLYNQLFDTLGVKGIAAFANISDALGDNFGAFVEQIQNTQLDSGNIEEQLRDILDGLKVDDVDTKALREFAYALEYLTDAGRGSLEAMQKHYKDVYQVALNLKQFDTVSADFYEKLSAGQREYFQLMADGNYQLIKDAKEFYGLTRKEYTTSLVSDIEDKIDKVNNERNTILGPLETSLENITKRENDLNKVAETDIFKAKKKAVDAENQWDARKADYLKAYTPFSLYSDLYGYADFTPEEIFRMAGIRNQQDIDTWFNSIQGESDDIEIGNYKISPTTLASLLANSNASDWAKNVDDYLTAQTGIAAYGVSLPKAQEDVESFNATSAEIKAEKEEAEVQKKESENKVSVLNENLANLTEQLLGSVSTFAEIGTYYNKYSEYLPKDSNALKNNLLRVAGAQYDYKAADDTFLAKEALDEYLTASGAETAEDYAKVLADIALGTKDLDIAQQKATDSLEEYQKAADKLASDDKLANYLDQINAQWDVLDAQKAKLDTYAMGGINQKMLASTLTNAGFTNVDLLFNEDGSINKDQYAALLQAGASGEFASEAEAAVYKESLEFIERYMQEYEALEDDIEAGLLNIQDLTLQRFNLVLDLQLDTNNARKEYENFKRTVLIEKDDYSSIGASYLSESVYGLNNLKMIESQLTSLEQLKQKGQITDAMYEESKKALIQQFGDEIMTVKQSMEAYEQSRLDSIEAIANAYEKQIGFLEDTNSLLEHQKQLTELIYGDKAGKHLTSYYDAALNNAKAIEQANKSSYEYWKAQYEAASAPDSGKSKEEIEAIYNNMSNAAQNWAASINATMQMAQEQYLNDIANSIAAFDEQLTGGKGMSALSEEWDWVTDQQDKYLTALDAVFEKKSLVNTFTKAMNDTTNVKAQEKINKLMQDELATLNQMDKISQKDIERAEKKLSILQAEIALQEAQDAKTQMRLVRGADGTYSYQYTADESKIAEAQENLEAAHQDLYQFDYNRYREGLDEFKTLYDQWLQEMEAAWADGVLSPEEEASLNAKKERLMEIADESARHEQNLRDTVTESIDLFKIDASEASASINDLFTTGLAKVVNTFTKDEGEVQKHFDNLMEGLGEKAGKFTSLAEQEAATMKNLFYGGEDSPGIIDMYKDLAGKQNDVIENYQKEKDALDALWDEYDNYNKMLSGFTTKYGEINTELLGINSSLDALPDIITDADLEKFKNEATAVGEMAAAWRSYYEAKVGPKKTEGEDGGTGKTEGEGGDGGTGKTDTGSEKPSIGFGKVGDFLTTIFGGSGEGGAGGGSEEDDNVAVSNFETWLDENNINYRRDGIYTLSAQEVTQLKKHQAAINDDEIFYDTLSKKINSGSIDDVKLTNKGNLEKVNASKNVWGNNFPTTGDMQVELFGKTYTISARYATSAGSGEEHEDVRSSIGFIENPASGWIAAFNGKVFVYSQHVGKWLPINEGDFTRDYLDGVRGYQNGKFAYKTGGLADFTGPAWLDGTADKPELVLNQDDTTNFLDALKILRSLNMSMLQNVSGLSNISSRFNGGGFGAPNIAQTVQIHAEFPDATDANEIKEAFNELVNLATQKALEHKF